MSQYSIGSRQIPSAVVVVVVVYNVVVYNVVVYNVVVYNVPSVLASCHSFLPATGKPIHGRAIR